MSKKWLNWLMVLVLLIPVVLTACTTEPVEEPPAGEPVAEEPAEEPDEAEKPEEAEEPAVDSMFTDVDPSGQTVVFWHVWGTGDTGLACFHYCNYGSCHSCLPACDSKLTLF